MKLLKVAKKPKYKDLREVMDYTRDFTMFYSGVEYEVYFNSCYNMGIRNFLMSYEYIRKHSLKQLTENFEDKIHLFIDSGAFTYQNDPKYKDYDIAHWESHIESYLYWVEKNKDYIFAIANLDIEALIDRERVKEWNRKYFEPFMLRTGIPVCFIWHEGLTLETYEQYCQRYPFVGIPSFEGRSTDNDVVYYKEKLKIAEKYNTLVHGMGMTKTRRLTQLPFYTVDSTSWKVGMRFGALPVWKGDKVQAYPRALADEAITYLESYPDIKFDIPKIREFYEPEMIRVGVYAYMKAEEFIIERLQSLEYWKKAKAIKNSINSLPPDFFPPPNWSGTNIEEVKEYARKMNINPDLGDITYSAVIDMTIFLNINNPEYKGFLGVTVDSVFISGAHDYYINTIKETEDERLQDLVQFFTDCLEGRNDYLLLMGTNFDRQQKEREEYIDDSDEDIEVVEVPKSEVIRAFHALLPTPADAIEEEGEKTSNFDSLGDDVYQEMGIIPVRDDEGNVLRYEKRRARKTIYSKKFPKFACDNCFVGAKCPEYKSGYVCAYSKIFKKFDTRNMSDVIQAVQSITGYDMERLQKAMIFEQLNGNIDINVSTMIETNLKHLLLLKDLYANASAETIRQTKVIRSDGSMESITQVSNPQEGGILSKLLLGLAQSNNKEEIDITPEKE